MTLASLIPIVLQSSIFLLVLSLGLRASPRDATYLFRNPRKLMRTLVAMDVIVPAFAVAVALVIDLPHAVEVALVAIAISPVPPFLPLKALKAGGQENYTIGVLVAAAALSVVFLPLVVMLIDPLFPTHLHIPAFDTAKLVLVTVLLPLAAGMAVRHAAPAVAARAAMPVMLLAAVLLAAALLPILVTAWPAILSLIGDGAIVAFAALVAVGLLGGHLLGGPEADDRIVLALASGSRHPGVAIALAHANFPDEKSTLPAVLLYLLVSAIVGIPYLQWVKRRDAHPSTGK